MLRIAIVDDHQIVRAGFRELLAEELGIPAEIVTARAVRGYALFNSVEQVGHEGQGRVDHAYFDSKRWTAYVRRVANKLRAMDARRGAA